MEEKILEIIKKITTDNAKAFEIVSHFKEFFLWYSTGNHPWVVWYKEELGYYFTDEIEENMTLDELYQYWEKEVKK